MSRKQAIEACIQQAVSPLHLEVVDESPMHSVPEGAESHFKLTVISTEFENQGLLERHRRINQLLADQFSAGLHALALHTWTPGQWYEKGGRAPESPPCLGGSKERMSVP